MNTMTYRGYAARIEYSDEDQSLVGQIAGINDVVGFHGDSVAELRTAFEEAVEDYLEQPHPPTGSRRLKVRSDLSR
jgi:predicted HicB family RNase H-like nuclease